jgi:benzodiazapine receptor
MQTAESPPSTAKSALVLVGSIALCQLAGATGAFVTDASWYRALDRPSWAPPGWIFGPVWITLYTLMGIAAWRIWRASSPRRSTALRWFAFQLALNAAWTPVFFGARSIGGGFVVIVTLLVAIAATIVAYSRISRLAAALMAPYLAWVAFATVLNGALWLRA